MMKRKISKEKSNVGDIKRYFQAAPEARENSGAKISKKEGTAVPSKPENQPYLTRGATRRKLEKSAENREPKRTSRRLRKVPGTPPRTPKKAKPPDTPKSPNIVEAFRRLSQKSSSEKSRTCDFPDDIIYVEEVHITDEGVSDEEIARKMNYNRSRGNWGGPNRGGHNRPNSNNSYRPGFEGRGGYRPYFRGGPSHQTSFNNNGQRDNQGNRFSVNNQGNPPWRNQSSNSSRGCLLPDPPIPRSTNYNHGSWQPQPRHSNTVRTSFSPPRSRFPSAPGRSPRFSGTAHTHNIVLTQHQNQGPSKVCPEQMRPNTFYVVSTTSSPSKKRYVLVSSCHPLAKRHRGEDSGPTSHPRQRPVGPRQVEGIPRSPSTVSSPGEKPVPNLNTSPQCPRNASTLPSPGEKPNSNLKSSPQCPRNGNNVCNIPVQKAEDNNKIASNDSSRNTQPQADAKSKPCNIESTAGSQAGLVQCRTEQNLGSSPKGSTVQSRAVIDKNLLLISPSQQAKISNLVKVSPLLSKMEKTFKRDVGEEVEDGCEEKSSLPTAPIPKRKSPSSVRKHLFAPQEQETITVSDDDFDLEEIDFVPSVVGSQQNFVPHVKLEKPDDVEMTPEKEDGIQKGLLNTKDGLNSGDTAKPVVKAETPLPAMPSPLTNTKASTSQLSNYNDSINSAFDIDDSEPESDDGDLLETPAYFTNINAGPEEEKDDPSPSRTKFIPSDSESELDDSAKNEISLDTLLSERTEQDRADADFERIEASVEEGLRLGGIRNAAPDANHSQIDDSDIDLPAEIQENVRRLAITKQDIQETHPGEMIFNPKTYKGLFSYPETLTLEACGFKQGKSTIDRHLATLPPEMLPFYLTPDLVLLCFDAISCPNAFMDWLFQLLSVHPKSLVVNNVYCLIYNVLQKKRGKGSDWVPSLHLISRVFMNYGVDLNTLLPHLDTPLSLEDLQDTSDKENQVEARPGCSRPGGAGDHQQGGGANLRQESEIFGLENLQLVYQTIAESAAKRPDCFEPDDVYLLIIMVLVTAMDSRLTQEVLTTDISITLSSLLYALPENCWKKNVAALCQVVHKLASHHHNKIYLVSVMPPCDRGRYLQRRLAFSLLHELLLGQTVDDTIIDLKVKDLHALVPLIQIKSPDTDYYRASSLIMLVDFSVGNENLPAREKADLIRLTGLMKGKMSEVRESINVMDRTLVKDDLVRLTSKWTFMYQGMGAKERTLFAYTTTSVSLPEGRVDCRDESDSDVEMDQAELGLTEDSLGIC